jgi:hypothetical protein
MQQNYENDNLNIPPEGIYLASNVWTDFNAMLSDYLMEGPVLS